MESLILEEIRILKPRQLKKKSSDVKRSTGVLSLSSYPTNIFSTSNDNNILRLQQEYEEDLNNRTEIKTRNWKKSGRHQYHFSLIPEIQLPDEWTLFRFFEADKFKVQAASKRLSETLIWRFEEKVNLFQITDPPEFWKEYQDNRIYRYIGIDFKGQPIMGERFGETLAVNNLKVMKMENWIKCIIHDTEILTLTLRQRAEEEGYPIHRVVNIYDMENFSLWKSMGNLKFLKQLDATLSPNFPELVDKIIVVNAASSIVVLYNKFVKVFLDSTTTEKVRIHDQIIVKQKVRMKKPKVKRGAKSKHTSILEKKTSYSQAPPKKTKKSNLTLKSFLTKKSFQSKATTATRYIIKDIRTNMFSGICDVAQLPSCYGGQGKFDVPYPHRLNFAPKISLEPLALSQEGSATERGRRSSRISSVWSLARSRKKSISISDKIPRGSVDTISTDHL